jgi:hypothetical protein
MLFSDRHIGSDGVPHGFFLASISLDFYLRVIMILVYFSHPTILQFHFDYLVFSFEGVDLFK